jgi:hypothetical protein
MNIPKITARGWPWQYTGTHWSNRLDKTAGEKWDWNPFNVKGMGRFGGGWAFKFGITGAKSCIILDLMLGSIRIEWYQKPAKQE